MVAALTTLRIHGRIFIIFLMHLHASGRFRRTEKTFLLLFLYISPTFVFFFFIGRRNRINGKCREERRVRGVGDVRGKNHQ